MYTYKAYVTKVYDADTITVDISLGFFTTLHDQKIRLYGINAPEIRGKEKERGKISRDYVRERILSKDVTIKTLKDGKGKYGRWLGVIWVDDTNLNEELVDKGLAIKQEY